MSALVIASFLGDTWRIGISLIIAIAFLYLIYFMMSRMGTF